MESSNSIKILLVILFILVFLGLFGSAYASSQNRNTIDEIDNTQEEVAQLTLDVNKLTTEVSSLDNKTQNLTASTTGSTFTGSLYVLPSNSTTAIDVTTTLSALTTEVSNLDSKTKYLTTSSTGSTFTGSLYVLPEGSTVGTDVANALRKQSYVSSSDTQVFDCNVSITSGHVLTVGTIDVEYSIKNLNNLVNEGLYEIDDLILDSLKVNNNTTLNGDAVANNFSIANLTVNTKATLTGATTATNIVTDSITTNGNSTFNGDTSANNLNVNNLTVTTANLNGITTATNINTQTLNGISSTTLSYVDPTSSIQTQLDSKGVLNGTNFWNGANSFTGGINVDTLGASDQVYANNVLTAPNIQSKSTELGTVSLYTVVGTVGSYTNYQTPIIKNLSSYYSNIYSGFKYPNMIAAVMYTYNSNQTYQNGQNYVVTGSTAQIPNPYAGYDYVWIVNPGFKLQFFRNPQYGSGDAGYFADNTTFAPKAFKVTQIYTDPAGNYLGYKTGSVKVFYDGVEIQYPYVSTNNLNY